MEEFKYIGDNILNIYSGGLDIYRLYILSMGH